MKSFPSLYPRLTGITTINTADNAIKMYAESAWRTLAKW